MSYPVPYGYPPPGYPAPGYPPARYPSPGSTQVVSPPRSSTAHVVIAWVLAVCTGFYLLPWAIAATRNKRNVVPIVLINIFLGWSVIGWIAALVMACLNDDQPAVLVVTQQPGWSGPGPNGASAYGTSPYGTAPYHLYGTAPYSAAPHGSTPPADPRAYRAQPPYQLPSSQPTAPYRGLADEPTQIIHDGGDPHRF